VVRARKTYASGVPITPQCVVSIEYTLTDADGRTLDTSRGRAPLAYLHGTGQIVAGLERALEGKDVGERITVSVPPEDGYGHFEPGLQRNVPIRKLPERQARVGMRFRLDTEAGPRVFTVTSVKGDYARIDGNHPLAGKTLNFDVEVVGIRPATPEELEHGHVHGEGGHHH
jgi:FKBP-type peptidyl-prolyl cis-trans isomerase SlyD